MPPSISLVSGASPISALAQALKPGLSIFIVYTSTYDLPYTPLFPFRCLCLPVACVRARVCVRACAHPLRCSRCPIRSWSTTLPPSSSLSGASWRCSNWASS